MVFPNRKRRDYLQGAFWFCASFPRNGPLRGYKKFRGPSLQAIPDNQHLLKSIHQVRSSSSFNAEHTVYLQVTSWPTKEEK
ncbi:hypothetical protein GT037_005207 [Alternaria burnsii]|uniref:Uncharacterized protein n=1 Tax=Alternaria burnsii TaxID=1187904 RepID=A0A8H7B4L0_9PLEO|nr:uncharacterized protein GT037_005207 [Alternaria burnsii]KAF7676995.1 hypothetical protein GT037_005207 [Alternaria burnsii]